MSHQDTIFIQELKITTSIGVYAWEKQIKQNVLLDLAITTDISKAAAQDDLSQTIDYKLMADMIITLVETSQFELIESLATAVANFILREFNVQTIKVTVYKPDAIPQARTVGVCIERSRPERIGA